MADFETRITILTPPEIEDLYGLPRFSEEERNIYFSMDPLEHNIADSHRSLQSKIFFILQLGYFKVKKLFFVPAEDDIKDDIHFIKNMYFMTEDMPENFEINKITRWNQQQRILTLYDYRDCDTYWRGQLEEKAKQVVRISSKPIYIFKNLLSYLEQSRVVLPAYSTMQDIVSKSINMERNRLSSIVKEHITENEEKSLQELLIREDSQYLLTVLKKEPKDFTYKEISRELDKQKTLKLLYELANKLLPMLEISNDNIRYYSSLVTYYSIFRIKRLHTGIFKVYILCFIYYRYQRINDNLINTLIFYVRKYIDQAKVGAKLQIYLLKAEGNRQTDNASKVLNLFIDDKIPDNTVFGDVKKIAFSILQKDKFPLVTQYISKAKFDEKEFLWKELETLSQTFKKNLRRVFVNLDFGSTSKKDSLMEAVDFLKENIIRKRSLSGIKAYNFPQTFITRKSKRYIIEKKKVKVKGSPRKVMEIKPDRYEFLIYSQLRECLESGDIYVQDSTQFQSFESDLVDDERWINKEQLIQDLNLPFLSRPIEETLMELKDEFETLLVEVNQRIKDGTNKGIKIKATKENIKWSFPYKKPEDKTNHPLFGRLPQIEIRELLDFVDSQCGFMNAFTHILGRYIKNESEDNAIVGSVIALATNKGILKMSESSDLTYQVLFSAMKNYLRLETLREANDRISNSLFQLPVFESFNIKEDTIHSSSDGQKFETQINTINARYSPKYFGLKKGVTSYTMVANNVPVNAKIIGANEHESHFVFDIVYNNTSDIRSDRHAVDTHGTNNVNFLVLHAFGYEFTPRYRDLNSKTKTIYGFKGIKEYEELLLKPTRKVNEKLIKKEWPNIQRILVSLGLKSTTQSVIIGKLSSYARKNRTKRAMWELDNIFRSIYLLKYIDDMLLRQNVQRALNRSEVYHQLRRAISHEHSGKFRLDTEEEQNVFSECSRLTANAIIFYNSYLLNKLISHMEEKKRFDIVKRIKKVSPIAWQHINLSGKFEFTIQKNPPNIDSMIGRLEEFLSN